MNTLYLPGDGPSAPAAPALTAPPEQPPAALDHVLTERLQQVANGELQTPEDHIDRATWVGKAALALLKKNLLEQRNGDPLPDTSFLLDEERQFGKVHRINDRPQDRVTIADATIPGGPQRISMLFGKRQTSGAITYEKVVTLPQNAKAARKIRGTDIELPHHPKEPIGPMPLALFAMDLPSGHKDFGADKSPETNGQAIYETQLKICARTLLRIIAANPGWVEDNNIETERLAA